MSLPRELLTVLQAALAIGRASGGAFDIGVGDAVAAWGFGPTEADGDAIRTALARRRRPASEIIELDPERLAARKLEPSTLDLAGIAKGYGVDRLAEVVAGFGLADALVAIDGELRALGSLPDGTPWAVAVEAPDYGRRAPHSMLQISDLAVATSGDYRHWVDVGDQRLSHTMDPKRGGPVLRSPASVTVLAPSCMEADAWATALMVLGEDAGLRLAKQLGLNALFLLREGEALREMAAGPLFMGANDLQEGGLGV